MDRKATVSTSLIAVAVLIAAVFVPLIAKTSLVWVHPTFLLQGYPNPLRDGFAWYKAIVLMGAGALASLGLALRPLSLDRIDKLLLLLAVLALLSSIFSPYQSLSVWGVPFLFEGLPVTLSYLALCLAAKRLSRSFCGRYLASGIALASLVVALLGLAEAAGIMVINRPFLANLLLKAEDGGITPYTSIFGAASVPFGNPNYMGMYAAMVWPFLLGQAFARKRLAVRFAYLSIGAVIFALLLASLCRGGFIAAGISLASGVVLILRHITFAKRNDVLQDGNRVSRVAPIALLFLGIWLCLSHVLAYVAIDHLTSNRTSSRLSSVPPAFALETFNIADSISNEVPGGGSNLAPSAEVAGEAAVQLDPKPALSHSPRNSAVVGSPPGPGALAVPPVITKIQMDSGRLRLNGNGAKGAWTLIVERQLRSIKFMDETFQPLVFSVGGEKPEDAEKVKLLDDRYAGLNLSLRQTETFRVLSVNSIDVAITNWGFRIGRVGAFVTPVVAERFPLPLRDSAFSFRGFVWSYSLPLLKNTLLLGHGAGSFPFDFPNNDPIKMSEVFGADSLVDKPHNFFISYAHTHGVLALLVLLIVFFNYFHRLWSRSSARDFDFTDLPYFLGSVGYLVSGITVDSTVGVSAIFWVLLGVGLRQSCAPGHSTN